MQCEYFSLRHHVAKRKEGRSWLPLAKGHAIRSTTIHTGPYVRVHTIQSTPNQGPYYPVHACEMAWSCAIPRRGGSANPSCTTKREPTSIIRVLRVCERPLLNSGILRLDSRSLGKRRRTEEKAHSHQKRILTPAGVGYLYPYSCAAIGKCGFVAEKFSESAILL